mmetsp:Transcript_86716/g.126821  ORF Transcript_86716/g.126821 Transcript_86716/m.126821 type:complete len:157 (+) Transcript_86716:589-1059(+)
MRAKRSAPRPMVPRLCSVQCWVSGAEDVCVCVCVCVCLLVEATQKEGCYVMGSVIYVWVYTCVVQMCVVRTFVTCMCVGFVRVRVACMRLLCRCAVLMTAGVVYMVCLCASVVCVVCTALAPREKLVYVCVCVCVASMMRRVFAVCVCLYLYVCVV